MASIDIADRTITRNVDTLCKSVDGVARALVSIAGAIDGLSESVTTRAAVETPYAPTPQESDAPAMLDRLNRCWLDSTQSRLVFVDQGPAQYQFADSGPFLWWLLTGEGGPK